MARIIGALRSLCLTVRDVVIPPELPELAPAPTEPDVWQDTVHPAASSSTEKTVQAWLNQAVAPVPLDGCHHCDLPPGDHDGRRYAALVGLHWWTEPSGEQATSRRKARDRAAGQETSC